MNDRPDFQLTQPKPRIVSWFSCGAASAVATKLAISMYGKDRVTVARIIVKEEHEDNWRFADDCEKWFDVPILNLSRNDKYGASIVTVVDKRGYVSGVKGAPCTRILKKEVREEFQRATDTHIFGYTADSKDLRRWDDFLDANNIQAIAPLIDRGIQHAECLAMVQDAGMNLPVMYELGYHHNNCIGCWKAGGQGYWNKIRVDFPLTFKERAEQSRRLGARILMDNGTHKFLDEITIGAGDYQSEPEIQCGVFCESAKREYGDA